MIIIKHASLRDVDDIFEWRNDPLSRKFSTNTKPISKNTHVKWFKKSLKNKRNQYFICYKNGYFPQDTRCLFYLLLS